MQTAARCSRVAAFKPAASGGRPAAAPRPARRAPRCVVFAQQQPAQQQRAGLQQHQQHQHQQQQQQQQQQRLPWAAAAAGAGLAGLLSSAAAAWADPEPTYEYPAQDDPLITVMFTASIGLLSIVTLGVIYLAVLSWFDGRQEKKDQEGTPFSNALAKEAVEKEERKRAKRAAVDKSKGFGQ